MKRSFKPKAYSRKKCPKGYISRRSYTKKSGTKVKAGCIKSKGLRSKGIRPVRSIPILKKGTLSGLGYGVHESTTKRQEALRRSLKKNGYSVTIKKLNAVRVLSRNTQPKNSSIYARDIKYVQSLRK